MYQRPAKPPLPTRRCYASLAPEDIHIACAMMSAAPMAQTQTGIEAVEAAMRESLTPG